MKKVIVALSAISSYKCVYRELMGFS